MERTHPSRTILACAAAAALGAAAAQPVLASGANPGFLPTDPVVQGTSGSKSFVRAETLNFFFDDVEGLLGADVLDRNDNIVGKVQELIVTSEGSISDMIVVIAQAQRLRATSPSEERIFAAGADAKVRRKAPTEDLMIVKTVSGGVTVKVGDHVADVHDFPEFRPAFAAD